MKRRCIVAGCTTLTPTSRCPTHRRAQLNERYGGDWARRSSAAIAAHRAQHGNWCPGWGIEAHPSSDLTLEHDGYVICRACNARKRASGHG